MKKRVQKQFFKNLLGALKLRHPRYVNV